MFTQDLISQFRGLGTKEQTMLLAAVEVAKTGKRPLLMTAEGSENDLFWQEFLPIGLLERREVDPSLAAAVPEEVVGYTITDDGAEQFSGFFRSAAQA
jgi:hypothetical protein